MRHDAFARRGSWLVDITVETAGEQKLAIEYDGSYWHADKVDLDIEKSLDLLAAGYLVARLSEHPLPLPPLPIDDSKYVEFVVYSTLPKPDETIGRVREWASWREERLAAQH
ncbi:hypothetical protein ACLVWQ_39200 [Streptomyces sp. CWNU-52B]|uniref:hypothetical protein n=1 Tax=unclassified Streptomyces TaxID=2593676 RepID=UPI0039BFBA7E